jgi:asparagine synthase (glutamine-hydrolysing)
MSGIAGIFNLDSRPVESSDLWQMVSMLQRRGPDGSHAWNQGPVGLGQTMLATTPEACHEHLPHVSAQDGLAIIADARIDNRDELIAVLGFADHEQNRLGDSELILEAYRKWGEMCPKKLLGDFAFAVWDPRERKLFCARDHFGVRPLYYYHDPGRILVFASEPRAILVLKQVPYRINEARIADFLVTQLEGIDKTSSFFADVYRLPTASSLSITPAAIEQKQYWTLETGPELKLGSDEAYAEAFLDVFTKAVSCRLRGNGLVGAMLSGGMDSGSVVAVASRLLSERGQGPLPTFSAAGPDPETCLETKTIHAALGVDGLDPHLVNLANLDELLPELVELTWSLDEPFDKDMTLVRAIYLAAHRRKVKAVLDGIDGDTILSEGSHIVRLLQCGKWLSAFREAVGQNIFWGGGYPAGKELFRGAVRAFVPGPVLRFRRALLNSRRQKGQLEKNIRESIISQVFADRVHLGDRLKTLQMLQPPGGILTPSQESARAINHPNLAVGVERYNRVASAISIEPRHPFLDRRLVEFCITLPGSQKVNRGWPKAILRYAMDGRLPDGVRWRIGKEHLGWAYTAKIMEMTQERLRFAIIKNFNILEAFIDKDSVNNACRSYFEEKDPDQAEKVYEAAQLGVWLNRHKERPQVEKNTNNPSFSFHSRKEKMNVEGS